MKRKVNNSMLSRRRQMLWGTAVIQSLVLLTHHGVACGYEDRLANDDSTEVASQAKSETEESPAPADIEFFEKKIRPILVDNCYVCHSEHHKEAGGLRVDDYRALTGEGRGGRAVVPGDSANSLLVQRITESDDKRIMPPDHRLSDEQIESIKIWIDRGAAWPPLVIPEGVDQTLEAGKLPNEDLKEQHWAWQPLTTPEAPESGYKAFGGDWSKTEVDAFVAAKLEEKNLQPVGDASRRTLLRRLTFDLTGLPPTEEEMLAYLLDDSPNATEIVVDRLLASKAFGERWGRHWLDVARYGESTGSARNLPYPHAWRYRDYVINAFNEDKPFDHFLREQIAGDLLEASTPEEKHQQHIATGFLALGVKDVNQRFKVRYEMDNVDEQIDTVSRAVLGLTVSCARCHDHKFDPISTHDYYALAGIFTSTDYQDALRNLMGGGGLAYYVPEKLIPLYDPAKGEITPELQAKIDAKKADFEEARTKFQSIRDSVKPADRDAEFTQKLQRARQAMNRKQAELVAMTDIAALGPVAIGVKDAKQIGDTEIRIRGEAEKRGPVVPRGFLSVLDFIESPSIPADQSGRAQLAEWLTHEQNPLTRRVIVNRIWTHLFSEGIVRTVDNFGATGDLPTHPELLDFLANKFVQDGWSHKKFIKYLVLSKTYQMSSQASDAALASDPSNKWLWRHSPRRLDAEEIRDSMLKLAGTLQESVDTKPVSSELQVIEIRNNGNEAKRILESAANSYNRSIYLPMVRGILPDVLNVFDFAEQGMVTGRRTNTTVAPQALFLLNDSFVRNNANALAEKLLAEQLPEGSSVLADDRLLKELVIQAYRKVLQRQPNDVEVHRSLVFLQDYQVNLARIARESSDESSETSTAFNSALAVKLVKNSTANTEGASEESEVIAVGNEDVEESLDGNSTEIAKETEVQSQNQPEAMGKEQTRSNESSDGDRDVAVATLAAYIHSLFSSAEFRYVR